MMRSLFLIGISVVFLFYGGQELRSHALAIRDVQDISAPIVSEVPKLEQRLAFLEHQNELTEFHTSLRTGSPEEYVYVYILPQQTNVEQTLELFELLGTQLEQAGNLISLDGLKFGKIEPHENYNTQPLTANLVVNDAGLNTLSLLIDLAGARTINDVLPQKDQDLLIQRSEEESPAGIVPLSEFLGTDLLAYTREPKPAEEKLLRSFSSQLFLEAFNSTIRNNPQIKEIKRFLSGPIGEFLKAKDFWPMQMMTLQNLELEQGGAEGWHKAKVTVLLYTRN